jgi:hypothetical protein
VSAHGTAASPGGATAFMCEAVFSATGAAGYGSRAGMLAAGTAVLARGVSGSDSDAAVSAQGATKAAAFACPAAIRAAGGAAAARSAGRLGRLGSGPDIAERASLGGGLRG